LEKAGLFISILGVFGKVSYVVDSDAARLTFIYKSSSDDQTLIVSTHYL